MNSRNMNSNKDFSLREQVQFIKHRIDKDNYANRNFEIASGYAKTMQLYIQDQERGENNYYELSMCPNKNPGIDSYVICTTKPHNDYAIQIKSGKYYDSKVKALMKSAPYKHCLNPDNYLLLTWDKFTTHDSFYKNNVKDESIAQILDDLEAKKDSYQKPYQFLKTCFAELVRATKNHDEANWIELNNLQAELLDKYECEDNYSWLPFLGQTS